MNKESIIAKVSYETGYGRQAVTDIVDSLLSNIISSLSCGDKVTLSGFGTFETRARAPRTGRNPHNGEKVPIPAKIKPVFTISRQFREAVEKEL